MENGAFVMLHFPYFQKYSKLNFNFFLIFFSLLLKIENDVMI